MVAWAGLRHVHEGVLYTLWLQACSCIQSTEQACSGQTFHFLPEVSTRCHARPPATVAVTA